jgi:hypothetical protein
MSRTSVCVPNPMAMPAMPAPASSGPMFTPSPASPIITAMTAITIWIKVRRSGSRVRTRVAPVPPSSPGSGCPGRPGSFARR